MLLKLFDSWSLSISQLKSGGRLKLAYFLILAFGLVFLFIHSTSQISSVTIYRQVMSSNSILNDLVWGFVAPLDSGVDPGDTSRANLAMIVVFDSTKLRGNFSARPEAIASCPEVDSALTECRRMSSAKKSCSIYLVLYKDDTLFAMEKFLAKFVPRFNITASVKVHLRLIPNRDHGGRFVSDVVREAYLDLADYFMIMQHAAFGGATAAERSANSTAPIRINANLVREMLEPLQNDSGIFRGIGLSVQACANGTKDIGSVAMLAFSKLHYEIIGFLSRWGLGHLSQCLDFITTAVYPAKFMHWWTPDGRAVPRSEIKAREEPPSQEAKNEIEKLDRYLEAVRVKPCLRCNLTHSRKVIAMSLYGASPRYTMGALRNAQIFPVIFPNWRLWYYRETPGPDGKTKYGSVPANILTKIAELGAEFQFVNATESGLAPMLWRFLVVERTKDVDAFEIRDCDSRLTPRDANITGEYLKTDKAFHCIRDHSSHSWDSINGGLWGGRPTALFPVFNGSLQATMKKYGAGYMEDMHFLAAFVWPRVKDNLAYCHDSFSCDRYESSHPFTIKRIGLEHLGQVFNEHEEGHGSDLNALANAGLNHKCIPKQ